jgi:hypothetical protein
MSPGAGPEDRIARRQAILVGVLQRLRRAQPRCPRGDCPGQHPHDLARPVEDMFVKNSAISSVIALGSSPPSSGDAR